MTTTTNASTNSNATVETSVSVSVSVDGNHCHFYAICAAEAPEVFRLPSDGRLRYTSKPDASQTAAELEAARLCPMQAIHVTVRHGR